MPNSKLTKTLGIGVFSGLIGALGCAGQILGDESDTDELRTPTVLELESQAESSVSLRWVDNAGGERGYEIHRASSSTGTFTLLKKTSVNATRYTDETAHAPGEYAYKVRAFSSRRVSSFSNIVSVSLGGSSGDSGEEASDGGTPTTMPDLSTAPDLAKTPDLAKMPDSGPTGDPNDKTSPSAPRGSWGYPSSCTSMLFHWDFNPEPDVVGYRVYVASNQPDPDVFWPKLAEVPANVHEVEVKDLAKGQGRVYVVTAFDASGNESNFFQYQLYLFTPGACSGETCDGIDNDGDGLVDEGFTDGSACDGPDSDRCKEGVVRCIGGKIQCSDNTSDIVESCNGLDDNCDGDVDEGLPACTVPWCYLTGITPSGPSSVGNNAVQNGVTLSNITRMRYRMRMNVNQTRGRIIFSSRVLFNPLHEGIASGRSSLDLFYIGANNVFGFTNSDWEVINERRGMLGLKSWDPDAYPVTMGSIDNIPGLWNDWTNYTADAVEGKDVYVEFSKGDTFTDPLTGWGDRMKYIGPDPTKHTSYVVSSMLPDGHLYQTWAGTLTIDGIAQRVEFAVPEDAATYMRPDQVLMLTTEFFEFPGIIQAFFWDIEAEAEGSSVWIPIRNLNQGGIYDKGVGSGVRLGVYNGKPVLELSNDGTDTYYKVPGEPFTLPTSVQDVPSPLPLIEFSAPSQTAQEGSTATVTVKLSRLSAYDVQTNLVVLGNAVAEVDYTGLPKTQVITIPKGQPSVTVNVSLLDDGGKYTPNQKLVLVLERSCAAQHGAVSVHTINISETENPATDVTPPDPPGSPYVTTYGMCQRLRVHWQAASDKGGSGVAGYNVYLDGVFHKRLPASAIETLIPAPGGTSHTVEVQTVDGRGNLSAKTSLPAATSLNCSTADQAAPTIEWVSGPVLSGVADIHAKVFDDNGALSGTFSRDGGTAVGGATMNLLLPDAYTHTYASLPAFDTRALADGVHTFTLSAVDAASHVTQSTLSVTIDNSPPSLAQISSPAPNATVHGTTQISANVVDAGGVAKVELYRRIPGQVLKVGKVTSAPYTIAWKTLYENNGNYELFIRAYDRGGNMRESAPITVHVAN